MVYLKNKNLHYLFCERKIYCHCMDTVCADLTQQQINTFVLYAAGAET
jgi:hypothetical protein